MKHWFRLHTLALRQTLLGMLRHPLTSLLNLLVIAIAAALPLLLWLVLASLGGVAARMPVEPQLTLFLKNGHDIAATKTLEQDLARRAGMAKVRYVPRDEALKQLEAATGTGELLAGLGENPLPDAFVLTLHGTSAAPVEALQAEMAKHPLVDEVQLDSAWAQRLEKIVALGRSVFDVLAALLALSLLLITGNAIRMQILTRREEIEVARLIGATDAFIRRPFVHFAAVQGVLGGLLACGVVALLLARINPAVSELAQAYGQQFTLQLPDWRVILLVCAATMLLTLSGAWVAVWRHLRQWR
ncbi:permease-like cell division protein FtsX [Chitinilyticum piscinae]|uniref:Cell division protein FtsX n=1 Tax=Chitinilyticum piscinae TaxID=2866724 RepID=A0A8J7K1V1_9NEIS|nr:permease-like cell division protein FtsX [Chitinilyticum piscinae]MBE9609127.1 ABC transporter permease [Chitinilyticum piscinae]